MHTDYAAQFFVGAATALAAAVFNLALTGRVDGGWMIVAFGVPFAALLIYQRAGFAGVRVWRVRENELTALGGQPVGQGAWAVALDASAEGLIRGPRRPLGRGRYRAGFQLKLDRLAGDEPVAELAVTARHGRKVLAQRTLTGQDFSRADAYQAVGLDFQLLHDENDVEFRLTIRAAPAGPAGPPRLTLAYVALARRLW